MERTVELPGFIFLLLLFVEIWICAYLHFQGTRRLNRKLHYKVNNKLIYFDKITIVTSAC